MGQSESKRMSDYRRHILLEEGEEDEERGLFRFFPFKYIQFINPFRLFWSFLEVIWQSYLFRRLSTHSKDPLMESLTSHPLLGCKATSRWIRRESPNLLILMRGLPGSGKSTLASFIKNKYPTDSVIVSADLYFNNPVTGEYNFRIEDLPEAHNQCQKAALYAMFEEQKSLIIVDNTSISKWEMEPYFALAASADYSVLVIHPSTPWAYDVNELYSRNIHDVPLEALTKKLKKALRKPIPLYYAWFLSNVASRDLLSCSYWILRHCLEKCLEFQKAFLGYLPPNSSFSEKRLLNALIGFYRPSENLLHVTSKYVGYDTNASSNYIKRVEEHLGEVHPCTLFGYTFSRYAFGARIRLTDEDSLELFDCDESFVPKQETYRITRSTIGGGRRNNNPDHHPSPPERPKLTPTFPNYMESGPSRDPTSTPDFFNPNPGRGKRAHITLGTRTGSQPVNTGYDSLRVAHEEGKGKEFSEYEIPGLGILRKIDSDLWTLYLFKNIEMKGLFTGFYK